MAAGRNMVARLLLVVTDRASAALGMLQRRLSSLAGLARRLSGIALLGGGLGLATLVPQAAAFESRLRDIAITAGNTGAAVATAVAQMRGELQGLALQFREGSTDLAEGLGVLVSRGLDPDTARQYLPALAEIRSASGAATAELAQLSVAIDRIAKVEGFDQMRQALAVALRGGQLGGAELRDMARYLPGVLAQMSALNTTGMRAVENSVAMFQVLRDGFGTMEEAAAGAQQLIGHLLSESTIKKAGELGLDLRGIYTDAMRRMARGEDIDPVEALLQAIRRVVSSDPSKIFEVLPDQNSRQAFIAFNAQLERYLDIRRQLRATTPAAVEQAGVDRRAGLGADLRETAERFSQIGDSLGRGLGVFLPVLNLALAKVQELLAYLEERLPGLMGQYGLAMLGLWGRILLLLREVPDIITRAREEFDRLQAAMTGALRGAIQPFLDAWREVAAIIDRIRGALPGLPSLRQGDAPGTIPPGIRDEIERFLRDPNIRPQSAPGLPGAGPERRGDWRGRVEIGLAPGLELRRTETSSPGVAIAPAERGLMLRPV